MTPIQKLTFLFSDRNELWDSGQLLIQDKEAGNVSKLHKEENIAIAYKVLEYKGTTIKQHRFSMDKCSN